MALRSFGARAFGARAFIPLFGKPGAQHSGSGGPAKRLNPAPRFNENDDELAIMLVCQAFATILGNNYGR
jgi:hypothetical protein